MLENLEPQAGDKILALMAAYRADPRDTKIDLGVGVYKDATGHTPIMRAIKSAEHRLWEEQDTKTYVGLAGDPEFSAAMARLVLGDGTNLDHVAAAATPGGTGAIRQGFELIRQANPNATVWISNPTWPNHPSILSYLGIPTKEYRYFDAQTRGTDIEGMLADLTGAKAGDVVLLHGCCHNPTGANLTSSEWWRVIDLMQDHGLIPFIDIAYQGFGDGLEQDAAATRTVVQQMPQTLIAASCSKNFGIYRERTGVLMAISQDAALKETAQGTLAFLNRQNFSFPPDHGARLVTMILQDETLRAEWASELEEVRLNMLGLRQQLADEMKRLTNSDRFDFIATHRGMFSRIGAMPEQVEKLRKDHGIYMVGDSRVNIAGLSASTVPVLARALVEAGV
jgi:aromatic-amino-acid transaminase